MTTTTTPPPHRISDTPPVFPCWLWLPENDRYPGDWLRYLCGDHVYTATHWHPDQPAAPTARPEQKEPPEKCIVCGGDEPCSHDFDKVDPLWATMGSTTQPTLAIRRTITHEVGECTYDPATTAAGTPDIQQLLTECPLTYAVVKVNEDTVHGKSRGYNKLVALAITLERELAARDTEVARLRTPEVLHAHCLRYMTEAQIAHLFGERMTAIVKAHADTLAKLSAAELKIAEHGEAEDELTAALAKLEEVAKERDEYRSGFLASTEARCQLAEANRIGLSELEEATNNAAETARSNINLRAKLEAVTKRLEVYEKEKWTMDDLHDLYYEESGSHLIDFIVTYMLSELNDRLGKHGGDAYESDGGLDDAIPYEICTLLRKAGVMDDEDNVPMHVKLAAALAAQTAPTKREET